MKGYEKLDDVFARAFNQASQGKGAERHATEAPFHEQPMQQVNAMVGVGFTHGQAIKKIIESQNMPPEQAAHELLGAICYLAGSIITIEAANDNQTMQPDIKNAMHEYLDENFQLQMVDELDDMLGNFPKKWIKVPEGAEICVSFKTKENTVFYKVAGKTLEFFEGKKWGNTSYMTAEFTSQFSENGGKIVWSRNPLPLDRDQARELLANMNRGEDASINGVKVTLGQDGYFYARLKGYLAEKTPSLNKILDYLENGN